MTEKKAQESNGLQSKLSTDNDGLNVINVDLAVLSKLERAFAVLVAKVVLVDLGVLGQLSIRLETPSLFRRVLDDDVGLAVLEFSQREEHNVALVDPHLFAHLATDMREPLLAIKAQCLEPPVTEHLHHLGILLAVFLEDQLSLVVVVFILSTSPILATL